MNMGYFKNSPQMIPLLMELHDAQNVYKLARDRDPEARKLLSRAVCEVLNSRVSERESELVADILIELMRQAEIDFRQSLSEQLALMDNVPLRLILQLANDQIDVARPVLQNSAVLDDLDLMYIIKSKPAAYWQAIAQRKALGEQVVDLLAGTRDFDTALNLVKNENITLTRNAVVALSDLAQGSEILSTPLLHREEVTNEVAEKLYAFVGQGLRAYIAEHYEINSKLLENAVQHVMREQKDNMIRSDIDIEGRTMPEEYMLSTAQIYKERGMLTVKSMIKTLRYGHLRTFIAQFSVYADLSVAIVEDVVFQGSGQKLAVMCKALGIDKTDFISLFLLSSKIRDRSTIVNTEDMAVAVKYFNRADPVTAQKIMRGNL